MKQTKKRYAVEVLLVVSILVLTGCGKKVAESPRTEIAEAQLDVSQGKGLPNDGEQQSETQDADAGENQNPEEKEQTALNTNQKTQKDWDDINLKERAEFEAKVKAAGGITEDEAIEIAKKAMEEDIGEKAKGLKLAAASEQYGWKAYLWDITDWEEYNAKGGELGWSIHFSNVADAEGEDDLFSYDCMVDAMDGSVCGANTRQGFIDGETVWYAH